VPRVRAAVVDWQAALDVEMVRQQAGISCTLAARLPDRLPEDTEIVLYRWPRRP
jgi:hypothetical protein